MREAKRLVGGRGARGLELRDSREDAIINRK
jgi:hypothetical protein